MRVIDPHVHFWDTARVSYPWLEKPAVVYSGDNRLLPTRYSVTDLLQDAGDVQVDMSVDVEANPGDSLAEARWLQALAGEPVNHGHPHGIVASVDLSDAGAPGLLERLSDYPNMRGVRQILNVHVDPRYNYVGRQYLNEFGWRRNLGLLAQYGWSFDLQIYPSQALLAENVIDANPNVTFILNHIGMFVDRNHVKGWVEWRQGLRTLAARRNTAIKLSGLAMFDHRWTIESFRPLVLEAVDAFGAKRCMFASNFPIDRLHASYPALWAAYAEIVSGASGEEREDLFASNAARYYRLSRAAS
jgi:predicted TIM-barrel fold metal-dependent hydrolase